MTLEQLPSLSVLNPIAPAIERVKTTLFKPFDFGKWFTIGFCAWLAQLGQGGFHFNLNFPFNDSSRPAASPDQFQNFFSDNLALIIVLGSIAFILGLAIFITCLWLSSRGRFMFLHCVAQNKAEVKVPWRKFKQQANSLFLFRLAAGVIFFVCLVLFIAAMVLLFVLISGKNGPHIIAPGIIALIFLFLIMVPVVIAFALLLKFTKDFIVPIMYLRGCICTVAWREFLQILSAKKGAFTLYLLFQIAIAIAIAAIIMAVVLMTCCCAACILWIPYIGTVLMLPLLIFHRAYSLCYLSQLGPGFDAFIYDVSV